MSHDLKIGFWSIYKLVLWAAIACMIFLCFYADTSLHNSIENSNYFTLLISSLCLACLTIPVLFSFKKGDFKVGITDIVVMCFLFYVISNTYLIGNRDSNEFHMAVAYLMIYINLRVIDIKYPDFKNVVIIIILCAGIWEAILTLHQLYGFSDSNHHRFAVTGHFINPGPLGIYLSAILVLSVAVLKQNRAKIEFRLKSLKNILASAALILTSVTVVATFSRAGWLSIVVALILLFKNSIWLLFRAKRLLKIILCFVVIASVSYGVYTLKKDSADGRLFIWGNVITAIYEKPLFGVGVGRFAENYSEQQYGYFLENGDSDRMAMVADMPAYVFNEPLSLLLCLGVVGFLMMTYVIVKKGYKTAPSETLYPIIALLVSSCFSYSFYVVPIGLLFVILLAFQSERHYISVNNYIITLLFIAILIYGVVISSSLFKRVDAYREWRNVRYLYSMSYYDSIVKDYMILYPMLNNDDEFMFEYGHSLNKTGEFKLSNDVLLEGSKLSTDNMFWCVIGNNYGELGNYYEAEKAYVKAYNMCPNRLYSLYLLSKLHYKFGKRDKALANSQKCIYKTPKVNSPAVEEMKKELQQLMDNE